MRLQKLHAYNADVKTEKHNFFKKGVMSNYLLSNLVPLFALFFKKLERFSHSIAFQKVIMVQFCLFRLYSALKLFPVI